MTPAKHSEYDAVREAFYQALSLHIVSRTSLQIQAGAIGSGPLQQTLDWENRCYFWNWIDLKRRFRNIPARFELSISVQGEVCGLAIGKPSRGRRHLSVYFIEGNPDPQHPLKGRVLPILLEAAFLYAQALGCSFVRLIQPVEQLHALYRRHGFDFGKTKDGRIFCEQSLDRRPL